MGKLKTAAVSVSILAALGLSSGALLMAYMNRPLPPAPPIKLTENLAEVAGVKPDAAKGDRVVKLTSADQGGNTSFQWTCGKVGIGGARAEDHFGHWNNLGGAVAYNAKAQTLLAVEVKFATGSFTSDNNTLTRTVTLDQEWFNPAFPEAAFTCASVEPRSAENEKGLEKSGKDWTHLLKGKFTLNGVTQEIAIPAKVAFQGESALIEADFGISRGAFKVEPRKISLTSGGSAMFTVDDEVRLSAKITAAPDVAVLVAELGKQVQAQQTRLKSLEEARKTEGKDTANRLIKLEAALEDTKAELKEALKKAQTAGPTAPATAPVDLASLPKDFEDALVLPALEKDYMEENPRTRKMEKKHRSYSGLTAPFKMILVPGDPAKGIAPFYIGETEATWDMFHDWSHWYDTTPTDGKPEMDAGLRPSNADSYGDTSHKLVGDKKMYEGHPALGITRKSAEAFCVLLSKQTGRTYRLPTEAEWELAHQLGGGDPATDDAKKEMAWCKDNSDDSADDSIDASDKFYGRCVRKVKTRSPNKLGIYDMLGNVAEWVKTPGKADADGKNTFVRGGDFLTPAAELSGKRREESNNRYGADDKNSWNVSYPNNPTSLWWYKDHFQVGFRLVCEPANLPKK